MTPTNAISRDWTGQAPAGQDMTNATRHAMTGRNTIRLDMTRRHKTNWTRQAAPFHAMTATGCDWTNTMRQAMMRSAMT
jgi:hypothetical protein